MARVGLREVAVFRALMLGDMLCATPALRALRHGLPEARLSLVGLPWAHALAERLATVDHFIEFPGWPGLPEQPPEDARTQLHFLMEMRDRHLDLALQMHGSGNIVNPLVSAFGARHMAGFTDDPANLPPGDTALFTPWPTTGTEVERMLCLTDHLGLPRQGEGLDFPLRPGDRDEAAPLLRRLHGQPFAIVHAGSQLPSRRWPTARFAAVADTLAREGLAVVLTGSATETRLTREVAKAMHEPALDLAGQTTLWSLGALVERAALVLCNDTGLSHVAAALATPSVVVASGSEVARWAPADAQLHRVLWHDVACRPCGYTDCPIEGHPCALGVSVEAVRQAALQQLQRSHAATS